jgi:hypothetical protein
MNTARPNLLFDQDPVHLSAFHVLDEDAGRYLGLVAQHDGRWYAAPLRDLEGCVPLRDPDSGAVVYVDSRDQATELLARHQPARHATIR